MNFVKRLQADVNTENHQLPWTNKILVYLLLIYDLYKY